MEIMETPGDESSDVRVCRGTDNRLAVAVRTNRGDFRRGTYGKRAQRRGSKTLFLFLLCTLSRFLLTRSVARSGRRSEKTRGGQRVGWEGRVLKVGIVHLRT